MEQIKTVQDLIECYKKLPGVGYRTAERLAYATLNLSKEEKDAFIEAFEEAETKVKKCPNCGTYYDEECPICSDPNRDKTTLLVVKDSKDILSIEKTNGYKGGYFTLKGTLSPLKNRNPEDPTKEAVGSQHIGRIYRFCVQEVLKDEGMEESIEISIPYAAGQSDLTPEILTWKTITTADWNPDTRQPVYKGDTK